MEAKFREASQNQLKKWARLADAKVRREEGLFIAEGVKVVGELLESGRPLEALLVMPEKKPHWERAIASAGDEIPVYRTGRREYKKLSQDKEPEGLLAVVKKEAPMPLADFLSQTAGSILILDAINNPSNLGALARSASWFGFGGIVIGSDSVDWTNPRAVRASMGVVFHRPVVSAPFADFLSWARAGSYQLIGTSARGQTDYRRVERYVTPLVLLLGTEREGLTASQMAACDALVRLPMHGRVTSLNLAIAAGVMLYTIHDSLDAQGLLPG